jgi:hypothetical protein
MKQTFSGEGTKGPQLGDARENENRKFFLITVTKSRTSTSLRKKLVTNNFSEFLVE